MFNIFKKRKETEEQISKIYSNLIKKQTAIEDYLDIEFFDGGSQKPHYRKKRVIKKPVGRPRKKGIKVNASNVGEVIEDIKEKLK